MRLRGLLFALFALAACDDKPAPPPKPEPTATATAATTATPAPTATATATATASAAAPPMPPRPVPIGSSGPIQPSAPPEQQMMAITYTLAMVAPRPGDPPSVDTAYMNDLIKKLAGAVRGVDKGKTPADPVKAGKGNRKIEVLMGRGCVDHVPGQLIQRASTTLKAAYEAGILVVACHDEKWECHQSTRDPKDVLCHAAPRR